MSVIGVPAVDAVSCNLQALRIHPHRHGPVLNTCVDRSVKRRLDLPRIRRCRYIPVLGGCAKQAVPHTSADDICLISKIPQPRENLCRRARNLYPDVIHIFFHSAVFLSGINSVMQFWASLTVPTPTVGNSLRNMHKSCTSEVCSFVK